MAAALLAAFAAPIVAGAADDPGSAVASDPVGRLFHAADGDGDGKVDGREAAAAGAWLFAAVDEDGDGWLSRDEMTTAPDRLTKRAAWAKGTRLATQVRDARRYMDRDANGWISRREFHGFAGYVYWMADTNRSGTLSRSEIDSYLQVYGGIEPRLKPLER